MCLQARGVFGFYRFLYKNVCVLLQEEAGFSVFFYSFQPSCGNSEISNTNQHDGSRGKHKESAKDSNSNSSNDCK